MNSPGDRSVQVPERRPPPPPPRDPAPSARRPLPPDRTARVSPVSRPADQARCPQCGGPFRILPDEPFARCASCRASLYVALDRIVLHLTVRPRLGAGEARGALERFLRAAEVDPPVLSPTPRLEFHPWWLVPWARGTALVPAAPESALAHDVRDATDVGDTEPFDPAIASDARVVAPLLTAEDAAERHEGGQADGARLRHGPLWRVGYHDGNRHHVAYVDAVEGVVDALALPASSTRRLDRSATGWFAGLTALFAVEAALIPGFCLPLLVIAGTGWAVFEVVRRTEAARR